MCLKLLVLDVRSQKHNSVQYILHKIDTLILGPKKPYPADKHFGELPVPTGLSVHVWPSLPMGNTLLLDRLKIRRDTDAGVGY